MKDLPAIGSTVCINGTVNNNETFIDVTIIAHYKDKAVYVIERNEIERVDMGVAGHFGEITPEVKKLQALVKVGVPLATAKKVLALDLSSNPEKGLCSPTNHNYTPSGFINGSPGFVCTKCGDAIKVL